MEYFHSWSSTEKIFPANTVYRKRCSDITALKLTTCVTVSGVQYFVKSRWIKGLES